jgi:3-oxoacyl-[acyl-carrier protein] reductase
MPDMNDQIAIVTGASRGIGQATAIRMARDFAGVVIVARTTDSLAMTANAIHDAGAKSLVIAADLREPEAATVIVKHTLERFGHIDALVNVAGAVPQSDLFTMPDAEWDDGMALKFHGARRLTLAAWESLRASRGAVVLTSGASALTPKPSFAAVGVINAAIVALAKAFSERGVDDGVQVNSVLPGPVMTDRRLTMLARYAEAHGITVDEAITVFADEARIARYGQPAEIADLIAFLVSPAARWMTGSAVRMDGGESKAI